MCEMFYYEDIALKQVNNDVFTILIESQLNRVTQREPVMQSQN